MYIIFYLGTWWEKNASFVFIYSLYNGLLVIYGSYYLDAKNTLKKIKNLSCTTILLQSHSFNSISKTIDITFLQFLMIRLFVFFFSSNGRRKGVWTIAVGVFWNSNASTRCFSRFTIWQQLICRHGLLYKSKSVCFNSKVGWIRLI